jgi:type I restriction enzyme S subunit
MGKVVVTEPTKTDLNFLYWLFLTPEFNRELFTTASGTKILHTSPNRIEAFRFRLPSFPIQQRITDILSALDDKIECNRRINQRLEDMARALYKHWFVDFEPFRGGEFVETDLGRIPEGFKVFSVYECANYFNGAAFRDSDFSSDSNGLPIIKIAELKNGITPQTRFTTKQLEPKFRLAYGDILFSWSGSPDTSIDAFLWCKGDAWLNQHTFRVIPYNPAEKPLVYFMLRHLKPLFVEIARNKQTTGLGHVTVQDMKGMKIAFPSDLVLQRFNQFAEPAFSQILSNIRESDTLANTRDYLLPKLLSGEIEIKVAEKQMAEFL